MPDNLRKSDFFQIITLRHELEWFSIADLVSSSLTIIFDFEEIQKLKKDYYKVILLRCQ